MALNWDMKKVHDIEELHSSDYEWAVTESIIFSTMAIDLGSISDSNLDEWQFRIAVYQNLHGAIMRIDGKPFYVTMAHIERRVGLKVNVVDIPRSKWIKKVTDNMSIRDIIRSQENSNEKIIDKGES